MDPLHEETGQPSPDMDQRLRRGAPDALRDLAVTWTPRLYRYLRRRGLDDAIAQDLTQEALLRAVRSLRRGTKPKKLDAWLYTIVRNLSHDHFRSAYQRRVRVQDVSQTGKEERRTDTPEEIVVAAAESARRQRQVRRAVKTLPPDLQEIVQLRFFEGQSVKASAQILNIPEGTVKSRTYRAYRALEPKLAPWYGPAAGEGDKRDWT